MAPSIKRGKIKAQVYGDLSSAVASLVVKTGETLGFISNNATTNGGPRGGVGDHGGGADAGGGWRPPHPTGINGR